jgi:hypothetical protein
MDKREAITLELDSEAIEAAKTKGLDLSMVLLEALLPQNSRFAR